MTGSAGGRRSRPSMGVRVLLACGLAASACSGGDDPASPDGGVGTTTLPGIDVGEAERDGTSVGDAAPLLDGGRVVGPELGGASVELTVLSEDPWIAAAVQPRPDTTGDPWSQWGEAVVLEDGRVISAMGDHLGVDGNAHLFVHDPDALTVTRFADVLSALDHEPGSWGYGKVHGAVVDPGGPALYFSTYWGTRRDLVFDGSYEGDVLFRLDKETLDLQPVTVPVPRHGIPSLATDGAGLIFGEDIDPLVGDTENPSGGFFVFDTTTGEVTLTDQDPDHDLFRDIVVDADGGAWFSRTGGSLFHYDPAGGGVTGVDVDLGGSLRASTEPTVDGTIYLATQDPDAFVAFDPSVPEVRHLGPARAYTTSLALLPDGSGFLHVPGAHGTTARWNAPLIAVDGETGAETVVAELGDLVAEELGLTLGGTYSVTVDPGRNRAHIGFNAGTDAAEPWGEVVFVVVGLP